MNTKLFLSLALALPMAASCGEATDAAGKAGDGLAGAAGAATEMAGKAGDGLADAAGAAKDMAGDALGALKNFDLSKATPDMLKDFGGKGIASITEKLGSIKDLASANAFKDAVGPMIEKLSGMKDKLGASLPGADALKSALGGLKLDGKIMEVLKPILGKLTSLVG